MPITLTLPSNANTPGNDGHTTDHNTIVTALTTLGADAANVAGDTFTGLVTAAAGVNLENYSPATPAASTATLLASSTGAPEAITHSGLTLPLSRSNKLDLTTYTVTQATITQFCTAFTIPANDPQVGALYRLTVWASGTQGSTQQTLTIVPTFAGASILGGGRLTFPSTIITASTSFNWRGVFEVVILTTGAGGTCLVSSEQTLTQNTGTPASANSMTLIAGPANTATSIDTTASHAFAVYANWASTTGSPTITSQCSMAERLGN